MLVRSYCWLKVRSGGGARAFLLLAHGERRPLHQPEGEGRVGVGQGAEVQEAVTRQQSEAWETDIVTLLTAGEEEGYALGNPFRGVKALDGFVVALR